MTAVAEKITKPGIYPGVPDEVYHADPVEGGSLSSTGAREVLHCPAKFDHNRRNPRPPKREFDLGHAAHHLVLGVGPRLEVVDAMDYKTKDARAQRDAAYAAGAVPLLPWEYDQVEEMAAVLRAHRTASALLGGALHFELTLVWQDRLTGVMCRARIDCLSVAANGRVLIVDYKTAVSAEPRAIDRVVQDRGYHQQMDWYMAGVMELGLAKTAPVPLLIVQEKTPPYVVTVSQISRSFLDMADVKNRAALELYALCSRTGHWPGYAEDVVMTTPPPWAERQFQEELDLGRYDIKGKAA